MDAANNKYVKVVIKYLWLVVLAAVVAGAGAYLLRSRQQAYYQSEARLFVGSSVFSPNPGNDDVRIPAQLAQTFTQLITYDVLQQTIDTLSLDTTPEQLGSAVNASAIPDQPIIVISVTYPDPELAAAIANEVATTLIEASPANLTEDEQNRLDSMRQDIEEIEQQIDVSNAQAVLLLERINAATALDDTEEVERLSVEYNRLIDQLNSARATLTQMNNAFLTLVNQTSRIRRLEDARPNPNPVGLRPIIVGGAGAVVGALLAMAALLYFEFSNTTLRTSDEVAEALDQPVLSIVSNTNKIRRRNKPTYLVTERYPDSRVAEEFRNARLNLLSQSRDGIPAKARSIFVVTSVESQAGKSFITANLAVSMAVSGLRVLLIDGDLRRPVAHEVFQLQNTVGLTNLIDPALNGTSGSNHIRTAVQQTQVPHLFVLTAGPAPVRPTELLGSQAMAKLINTLFAEHQFDAIIIDTPPCLVVSDASAVAVTTGASVVLIVEAGRTKHTSLRRASALFDQLGVDLQGVILNRSRVREKIYAKSSYYRL